VIQSAIHRVYINNYLFLAARQSQP